MPLVTKVHHEAKVRAGKGYTILYVGHEGHDEATGTLAVAPADMRLVETEADLDRALPTVDDPSKVTLLAQTTLSMDDWNGIMTGREQFPDLWTATRDDLCFATTNRQTALRTLWGRRRRDRGDRKCELLEHDHARQGRRAATGLSTRAPRRRTPRRSIPSPSSDTRVVGVTAGAAAPEDLVQAVIERLAPVHGVETVHVTDEDEYFPPPREIRELAARMGRDERTSSSPRLHRGEGDRDRDGVEHRVRGHARTEALVAPSEAPEEEPDRHDHRERQHDLTRVIPIW